MLVQRENEEWKAKLMIVLWLISSVEQTALDVCTLSPLSFKIWFTEYWLKRCLLTDVKSSERLDLLMKVILKSSLYCRIFLSSWAAVFQINAATQGTTVTLWILGSSEGDRRYVAKILIYSSLILLHVGEPITHHILKNVWSVGFFVVSV